MKKYMYHEILEAKFSEAQKYLEKNYTREGLKVAFQRLVIEANLEQVDKVYDLCKHMKPNMVEFYFLYLELLHKENKMAKKLHEITTPCIRLGLPKWAKITENKLDNQ